MKPIFLLVMLFLLHGSGWGQSEGLLKNVLFDYESNQILRVYEDESESYLISQGTYKGFPTIDYLTTVIFQNGAKKVLQKNEMIIAITKRNLITQNFDVVSSKTKILSYQFNLNTLIPLNQIEFDGEQQINVLENGAIIISDQWEMFGTTIQVYNSQLKLLNKFKPFENGFRNAVFTASGNKVIAIVSKVKPKQETKYYELDVSNGSIIFQRELETSLDPVKVLSFSNKTFVVEDTKIIAITSGGISWRKNIVLPNYDIAFNASQNAIYYCTANELVKLSATDGKELFSKKLSEIYGKVTDATSLMLRPIVLKASETNAVTFILLAETNRGILLNTIPKINAKLFSIDVAGNVLENRTINFPSLNWMDIIETKEHKIKLVTNKQQIDVQ